MTNGNTRSLTRFSTSISLLIPLLRIVSPSSLTLFFSTYYVKLRLLRHDSRSKDILTVVPPLPGSDEPTQVLSKGSTLFVFDLDQRSFSSPKESYGLKDFSLEACQYRLFGFDSQVGTSHSQDLSSFSCPRLRASVAYPGFYSVLSYPLTSP